MVAACPFPTSQGSQVLIRELSEALVRRGHEVHIVTYHFGENIPCKGMIIHRIPEFFPYSKFRSGPEIRKPLLDLQLSYKLNQVVKEHGVDIMHCHNYEAPVAAFPVRFLRGIPVVYHSHNTMSDEFYTYFRLKIPQILARGAAHLMDRYIPRRADFVIAINRSVADFLIQSGTPPDRVKYIPPGIDYGDQVSVDEAMLRQKYNLGEGPLIIYSGNLDGYQRMDILLKSLPDVVKSHNSTRLVILTSSDADAFLKYAEEQKVGKYICLIKSPGFDVVKQLYKIGTLAVNPRISWSGFPIKLLNYMAAGLPIVAFHGAAPSVLHGSTGLLAPAGNSDLFGKHICRLIESPEYAESIGNKAKGIVKEHYCWDSIANDIEQVYAKILNLKIFAEIETNKAEPMRVAI